MADQINLPDDAELKKAMIVHKHEVDKLLAEQGFFGRAWGSSPSIPNNIAAFVTVFSMALGALFTIIFPFIPDANRIAMGITIHGFWAIMSPILSLAIGYLFGTKAKDK